MANPIELRVEKLVYGGDGLGHYEGHTVFVPFVLPEETVSVDPLERRKKFIRGRVAQITTASPERIAARCPHFGTCGGCNYQHMPYELQIRAKTDILRETLSRLGRVTWDGPVVPHVSPPFGYRNRAQWKIARNAAGAAEIGYFEAGSQKLCPVRECPIVSPLLHEALLTLARLLTGGRLTTDLQEVEAFADADDQKLLLNLAFAKLPGTYEPIAEMIRAEIPQVETILFQDQKADRFELSGPGHISYRVGDHNYRVGHLSFFQVNRFLLPELVNTVIGDAKGRLALDLYAGVGLFTLPLAHRFERVIGVESNQAAARDLAANLQESGASSPAFRETDAESFLARWSETPDLVVLDPPRAGVAAPALTRLAKMAPAAIAYLSCDPATLARDLAVLVGSAEKPSRYLISEVHLVDIFPQTYHMEVLVRLLRRA
jgi:23S rRNA (uracil1939-C5)-methyltransferase